VAETDETAGRLTRSAAEIPVPGRLRGWRGTRSPSPPAEGTAPWREPRRLLVPWRTSAGRITRRTAAAAANARAGEPGQAVSRRASSRPHPRGAANPSERARRRATLRSSPFRGPRRCGAVELVRAGESGEAVAVVDWRDETKRRRRAGNIYSV
jgi:hypothetical protein